MRLSPAEPVRSGAATRIVLVTPGLAGADGISAVSRLYLQILAARAARAGIPIETWSLNDTGTPEGIPAGVRVRHADRSVLKFLAFGVRATAWRRGALVVVLHVGLLPALAPLLWRGVRLVPVLHGIEAWVHVRRRTAWMLRYAWRAIAVSAETRRRFIAANSGLSAMDVRVCHSALAGPGVEPSAADVDSVRRLTEGRPCAVIVGRLAARERYKGHDALLDAWPLVVAAVPDARLLVVGEGDDAARLRARAADLCAPGSVVFAGRLTDAQVEAVYREARFLAMPSTGEGLGLVYLEAMRAGRPCLASPGAAEEVVVHGENGVIVLQHDRAALVAWIVRLFQDHAWRDGLGREARRTVTERFTVAHLDRRLGEALGCTEMV
jgi:phosphatidylinositol alpha-1,6-mannosyltransferase